MDVDSLVDRANRITEANTAESQVFRRVLMAQDGVSQVLNVTVKVAAYKFEDQITTTASSKSGDSQSGMAKGFIVLIIVMVLLGVCLMMRKRLATADTRNNAKDTRQSPGTLLHAA